MQSTWTFKRNTVWSTSVYASGSRCDLVASFAWLRETISKVNFVQEFPINYLNYFQYLAYNIFAQEPEGNSTLKILTMIERFNRNIDFKILIKMLSRILSFAALLRVSDGRNIVIYMLPLIIIYTLHIAARRNGLFNHRLLLRHNFSTYKIRRNPRELTRGTQRHPGASVQPNSDCMLDRKSTRLNSSH